MDLLAFVKPLKVTIVTRTNAAAFIEFFCAAAAAFIAKFIPIELTQLLKTS